MLVGDEMAAAEALPVGLACPPPVAIAMIMSSRTKAVHGSSPSSAAGRFVHADRADACRETGIASTEVNAGRPRTHARAHAAAGQTDL